MPPGPADTAVRGRPSELDALARVACDVGARWRARSVVLLDAMDAAAVAELRGLAIETAAARRLAAVGAHLVDAGHAIGAFSQALRSVDHLVDRRGVTTASRRAVARWLLAHRDDRTDPAILAVLAGLPDGRRRSLEDFEQMSASERMAWIEAFVVTSGDARHRAISGVLAYFADSPGIRGDDRSAFGDTWWSVADAAVILVIQDGWLRSRGLATPADRPYAAGDPRAEAYEDAVDAWADHVIATEAGGMSDHDALRSWIGAEQAGVRFAEIAAAHAWRRDPWFVAPTASEWEAITRLVPGTHTFRLSVLAGTQRAFLRSITDAVIDHLVGAAIDDPAVAALLMPGFGPMAPGMLEGAGDAVAGVGGGWGDSWGLGAATSALGIALGGLGALHRSGIEATTAVVEAVATETAGGVVDAIAFLTPDLIEAEFARALVDPTIVPCPPLREGFDLVFGTDRADDELPFSYYFPMLIESGLLPPLPDHWVDRNGRRHQVPAPVRGGPLRPG